MEYCNAENDSFVCTEKKGHKGDHIAKHYTGKTGKVVKRWPQK